MAYGDYSTSRVAREYIERLEKDIEDLREVNRTNTTSIAALHSRLAEAKVEASVLRSELRRARNLGIFGRNNERIEEMFERFWNWLLPPK